MLRLRSNLALLLGLVACAGRGASDGSQPPSLGADPEAGGTDAPQVPAKDAPTGGHAHGHGGHHGHGHGHHAVAEGHRHAGGHHRFEDAEAWAKVFDDPERDAWQRPDAVVAFLNLTPAATVADVGAGTGYFTVRLARAVPEGRVVATDIEPDMVAYLRKRAAEAGLSNVSVVRGAPDDPKLPEAVDVVLLVDVFHHIEDPAAFFRRVRERLAPGGRVVVVDFRPDAPEDAPGPPRAMRMSVEAVEAAMVEAGFRRARTDTATLPYQYMVEFVAD